ELVVRLLVATGHGTASPRSDRSQRDHRAQSTEPPPPLERHLLLLSRRFSGTFFQDLVEVAVAFQVRELRLALDYRGVESRPDCPGQVVKSVGRSRRAVGHDGGVEKEFGRVGSGGWRLAEVSRRR